MAHFCLFNVSTSVYKYMYMCVLVYLSSFGIYAEPTVEVNPLDWPETVF